ncbi:DUF7601 domain-containing protein [Fusibacillus kribbianus]|uniref:Fibro-slime domain-containing protein n=1 Tax=Fusibacillus kribbianus TaxID=3044208 RepID=A0AAP4B7P8_9FIRM|nr:fibro-slime domain-containing protein [Ruminococcus sp. YH-rum2234]MDI9241145.1 fibro-slime domain-containing protein [Ruminococcus sp. YH-rum2234]
MQRKEEEQAEYYKEQGRRRRIWKKVVGSLACVVVFITTYMLILPAITLEKKVVCGLEEHVHTESCYVQITEKEEYRLTCSAESLGIHIHTDACYDEAGNIICGYGDYVVHSHDTSCYDENGNLVCTLPEISTSELHTHSQDCYDENGNLVCGKSEAKEHTHTEACFSSVTVPADTAVLTCTIPEDENHTHTALCYGQWMLVCEKEEHTHTEECYKKEENSTEKTFEEETAERETDGAASSDHTENNRLWEKAASDVRLTGEYAVDVLAVAQSQLGYEESKTDRVSSGNGDTRGYTLYGDWYGDAYGDWCAMFISFCLDRAGVAEMPLEANCVKWIDVLSEEECGLYHEASEYDTENEDSGYETARFEPLPGDLIFFDYDGDGSAEHVGIVAELIPETEDASAMIKTIEGNTGDRVQYMTYEAEDPAILGYGRLPEQEFVCGQKGHVHDESCTDSMGNLLCGMEEHIHEDTCKSGEEQFAEKESSEGQISEEAPSEPGNEQELFAERTDLTELVCEGADYTITVQYGPEAALPENVVLTAEEIPVGSEEYKQYLEQAAETMASEGKTEIVVYARFFDIQFQADGQKLEPEAPVSVTITYKEALGTGEGAGCQAVHFTDEETELLEVQTERPDESSTSFTHMQEGFSVVGNLVTENYSVYNSTDVGPNILPVDYYVYIDGEWVCVGSTKTGWYGDNKATGWQNDNRDCITVEQAGSVLGAYGFDTGAGNAALQIAYQRKETDRDAKLHSDTLSYVDENKSNIALIPLARNADPKSGYNVYFLPGNTNNKLSVNLDSVATTGSEFYTVQVYDPNHLVYGEDEPLPGKQVVRSGGSSEVTVNGLPEDSGAVWRCVDSKWTVVSEGIQNEDGTITFTLTNVTQPLRITPLASNLGTRVEKPVYFVVFLDGEWKETGTATPIYDDASVLVTGTQHRHYITSGQAESILAPYGFSSEAYSYQEGQGNVLAHQLGKWDLNTPFYTDNGAEKLADGTWAIGLSYSNNDVDYSVYYLPVNPAQFQGKQPGTYTAESAEMAGNRFWSVSVRDDNHSVYSDGELSSMTRIARDNDTVTVTVRNAEGILWSCVGKNGQPLEVEASQQGGNTTFIITNVTQPVEVVATKANPGFTVQYYANIPRFATSGSNPLKVIDTSGKALPTNGGTMATRNLYLEGTRQYTDQNKGNKTQLYRIQTTTELTRLYSEQEYRFEASPSLEYFNKLKDNDSYTLKEIWILKAGKDAASTNREDWDIYSYNGDTAFTNEAGQVNEATILITDGAVIRLVSDTSTGAYYNGTTFYDYNISSGQNSDGRWRTGITGINSESNYDTSLNGQRTWRSGADIFAFGNANCGTGMSGYLFDGSTLNKHSSKNSGYGGATFGLAAGLNDDGTIRYNEWVVAPKLFNDGDATGKQTYSGSSLTFDRVGDTYTLSAATLNNSNGQKNTLSGLQYFFNPSPTSSTTHTHIFTNNFWPMDPAAGRTDALWGAYGNPGSFQGYTEANNYSWGNLAANFPASDDGNNHNWFFGMNFAVSFNLTEDYEGPLEYYFFGDDDLWVFLDNQLVCDIGGVHSSIGEYVNLRDYLPVGSSGQHTLTFFYTERGASGSTCYMSFTLPSVSGSTVARDTGSLQIAKNLNVENANISNDTEFEFQVDLLEEENGDGLRQTFSYARSDGTYGTIKSGGTLKLKASEFATISGIPAGTFYRVTERTTEGYKTTVNGKEGYIVKGTIENGGTAPAEFVNTPFFELPETGGPGTWLYTLSGIVLMAAALLYKFLRRKRGEAG